MEKRNHIVFGIILNFIFIYFTVYLGYDIFPFNPLSIFMISGIIVFYSLLPDIDHRNSTITWWFFGLGIFGLIVGILELSTGMIKISPMPLMIISTIFLTFTFAASNFFDHRGIIHSIPVGLLAVLPLYFLFNSFPYCLLAFVSWYSHLLGDGYIFKLK